jgi:hypothetical protein
MGASRERFNPAVLAAARIDMIEEKKILPAENVSGACCPPGRRCCSGMTGRVIKVALALAAFLVLLSMSGWFSAKTKSEMRQYDLIGRPAPQRDVISVSGEGKVKATPDVAVLDLGMTAERKTVSEAQAETTRVMNALTEAVKAMGVEAKDIQTANYSIYPANDWNDGKQTLRGYTVNQSLRVKVRKLDSVSGILAKAGELGANQVGGVSFTIDEPKKLQAEARVKAIEDAQAQAQAIADAVGLDLGKVVSFSEGSSGGFVPSMMESKAMGMGGDEAAPVIEPGQNEVVINAYLTYELK